MENSESMVTPPPFGWVLIHSSNLPIFNFMKKFFHVYFSYDICRNMELKKN